MTQLTVMRFRVFSQSNMFVWCHKNRGNINTHRIYCGYCSHDIQRYSVQSVGHSVWQSVSRYSVSQSVVIRHTVSQSVVIRHTVSQSVSQSSCLSESEAQNQTCLFCMSLLLHRLRSAALYMYRVSTNWTLLTIYLILDITARNQCSRVPDYSNQ